MHWVASPALDRVVGGNSLRAYLLALLVAGLVLGITGLYRIGVRDRLRRMAARTTGNLDDLVVELFDRAFVPLLAGSTFLVVVRCLRVPAWLDGGSVALFIAILVYFATTSVLRLCDHALDRLLLREAGASNRQAREVLGFFLRVVTWSFVLLLLLRNLGIDVTSLLAGMGIGGIALALGVQSIMGDLFSYFAILVDKPFRLGDFLVVGENLGTVERIGLKTTRLRALSGEQIIFSNSDLLGSRIRNFRRMRERRAVFEIGVEYGTPRATLEKIPGWIREAIATADEKLRVDRIHFRSFGTSSLDFEAVYFLPTAEYNDYADAQERINLEIYERFLREGVAFAFPTRTVHLARGSAAS